MTTTRIPRRRIAVSLAGVVALAVTACTAAPEPGPASQTATNSPSRLPTNRPHIPRPLDAGSYRDKPCALFTDEQALVLGILEPGRPDANPDYAVCHRISSPAGENDVIISYYFATDLLGEIYRGEAEPLWPMTRLLPITVARQPAVRTNPTTTEECKVAVGLADTQGFVVRVNNKKVDSCERAVMIAETIVHNLGG